MYTYANIRTNIQTNIDTYCGNALQSYSDFQHLLAIESDETWFCWPRTVCHRASSANVRNQTTGAACAPQPLALLPRGAPLHGPPAARSVAPGHCIFVIAGFAHLWQRSAATSGASVRKQTTGAARAPRTLALLPHGTSPQGPALARSVELKEQHRQSTQHARGELEELKKRHQHSAEAALGQSARALVAEFAGGQEKGAEGLTNLKEQHWQSTQHARGELEELKKRHQHSAEAALGLSARALVAEFARGRKKGAEGLTELKEQHRQSTQHVRGKVEELKKRHQHSAEASLK